MKRKQFIWSVVILALLLIGIGYYVTQQNLNEGDTTRKIGVILPLTGNTAFIGQPMQNAIKLKQSEFNDTSDVGVQIIFEDSQAESQMGVSAFRKLLTQNVKAVIGPVASSVTLAVAPIAQENEVVIFSPSSSSPLITDAGDYIFRNELSDELGASRQAELAYDSLGWERISILNINNDYGAGVVRIFENRFQELGGNIVTKESYSSGTSNFRSSLNKIKNDNSEAVLIVAQSQFVNIINQYRALNIEKDIYTTPIFEDEGILNSLGSAANGIVYTYYGTFDLSNKENKPKAQKFYENYLNEFGEQPTYYAALAYENASILLPIVANSESTSEIKNKLYNVSNHQGLTGNITIDKNGDVIKPVILKRVKDGEFIQYY